MVFGSKKKEKQEDFERALAITEEGRPITQQEFLDSLGKLYYLIKDDQESELLAKGRLKYLIPAFSPLNQLTNIDKDEAEIRRLKYKVLLMKEKGYMNANKYQQGGSTLFSSLEIRSRSIVSDALGGWKGRIATETTKVTRHEFEKKRRFP